MDSTKQVETLNPNKWITFRKVIQPEQTFQSKFLFVLIQILINKYTFLVDVVSGRFVARILNSRPEEIRFFGNGIVYPISTILSAQTRTAADELARSYQYEFFQKYLFSILLKF